MSVRKSKRMKVIIEYKGSIVEAERDERGLYSCPICNKYLFYSPSDLMHHIVSHAKGIIKHVRPAPRRH